MLQRLDELIIAVGNIPTSGPGATSVDESWRDGFCVDCVHWDEINPTVGFCRRYPPSVEVEMADGTQVVQWPQTADTDTCSEYVTFVTP